MSQYILEAAHIQKKYGRQTVLRDVSIHVKHGGIYGLIGKNGSGKTTLFRILTGLIQGYSGVVTVSHTGSHESNISAVIDSPSLFLNMSAFENMKAQSFLLGIRDNGRIRQALETVRLSESNKKPVRYYSLGMTQRLKLAMALVGNPEILILDEPANGLDPEGVVELRELLIYLNRTMGKTILVSSHILSELEQIVTCLGILHDGEIVRELSDSDILQNGTGLEKLYMEYARGGNRYE